MDLTQKESVKLFPMDLTQKESVKLFEYSDLCVLVRNKLAKDREDNRLEIKKQKLNDIQPDELIPFLTRATQYKAVSVLQKSDSQFKRSVRMSQDKNMRIPTYSISHQSGEDDEAYYDCVIEAEEDITERVIYANTSANAKKGAFDHALQNNYNEFYLNQGIDQTHYIREGNSFIQIPEYPCNKPH